LAPLNSATISALAMLVMGASISALLLLHIAGGEENGNNQK